MKILVVDDKKSLADLIANKLSTEGYDVDVSYDGIEAYDFAMTDVYDLIVLDVMLPGMSGIEVLKLLRENNIETKIIMLTAKTMIEDKLTGLRNGANDYLTKPFHMEELIARIKVQLSTNPGQDSSILKFHDIELNTKNSTLTNVNNSESVELVLKEMLTLECFIRHQNQILSKDKIRDKVWGFDNFSESNNMEVYISFLRKKLRAIESQVNIKAARGLGYKLEIKDE